MNKKLVLLFLGLLLFTMAIAQKSTISYAPKDSYSKQWEKIYKLLEQNKFVQAAHIIDTVYENAKVKNEPVIMLKAQLYFLQLVHDTSDNVKEDLLNVAEQHIKEEKFPYNAIWQSITAQLYWDYYQANRQKILERPIIPREIILDDIDNWDVNRFFDKTATLYLKSISRTADLQSIDIKEFAPVLYSSANSENLLPTLFDLLLNRALHFFETDEKDIIKPNNTYHLDDINAFVPATAFTNQKFATNDLTSYTWLSLQWYKQLLMFHENDSLKDAYIDADLRRLAFVYKNSVLPNKKQLYMQALQFIEQSYPVNQQTSLAWYTIAELTGGFYNIDSSFDFETEISEPAYENSTNLNKINYNDVVSKLYSIISKYPNSMGAKKAEALISIIENKVIKFETEKTVLPYEPSKFLLTYRNTNKVWVKVVQLSNTEYRKKNSADLKSWLRTQLKKNSIYNSQVALPGTDDYKVHSTEIKISALQPGLYALYVSGKSIADSNFVQSQIFQVSNLCYISQTGNSKGLKDFILNRKTGEPIPHVFIYRYNRNESKNRFEKTKTHIDGSFSFKQRKGDKFEGYINIIYNKDTLWEDFNKYNFKNDVDQNSKTFFFTDRSIYKPGQTVYFKGITVKKSNEKGITFVLKNKQTEVYLKDENEEIINKLKVETNKFGSFSSSFLLPNNLANGILSIGNETGITFITVNEGTSKKINVKLDVSKLSYSINDNVKFNGVVSTLSGNNIEGASVNYSVTRSADLQNTNINKSLVLESQQVQEIFTGNTHTEKDGKFAIEFTAIPDQTLDKKIFPIYSYNVHVEVTGLNGEEQTLNRIVRAGYSQLKLLEYIPEVAAPKEVDTIIIKSQNLEGYFVPTLLHLSINRLQSPPIVYKKRLWKTPDVYVMDSIEFRKYFQFDEYKNESVPSSWKIERNVYDSTFTTNENGLIRVPIEIWNKNGWYALDIESKNNINTSVYKRRYLEIWDKNQTEAVIDPLLIIEKNTYSEPGEYPEITILSGFDSCTIIKSEQNTSKIIAFDKVIYDGSPLSWKRQIIDEDRGGVSLNFAVLKNNRLYTKNVVIHVPWSNKELDIKWDVHKEKLIPGTSENWQFNLKGNKQENTSCEMLAFMYDASLDGLNFNYGNTIDLFPTVNAGGFKFPNSFTSTSNAFINVNNRKLSLKTDNLGYDNFIIVGDEFKHIDYKKRLYEFNRQRLKNSSQNLYLGKNKDIVPIIKSKNFSKLEKVKTNIDNLNSKINEVEKTTSINNLNFENFENKNSIEVQYRKYTKPTLFFYPNLSSDTSGNIQFDFSIPYSNCSDYKFKAFAHSQDMMFGSLEGKLKTQRDFELVPFIPNYLRQGDILQVSSAITNFSDSDSKGIASLHIVNAITLQLLDTLFNNQNPDIGFHAKKETETNLYWEIKIPDNFFYPVKFVFSAQTDNYTDEKEADLQVLNSNKVVTETFVKVIKDTTDTVILLNNSILSDTSKQKIKYSANFIISNQNTWIALKSLSSILESKTECTEQIFGSYFANTLAINTKESHPEIEQIFAEWQNNGSKKINNSILDGDFSEMTWLSNNLNDDQEKVMFANAFRKHKLQKNLTYSLNKLHNLQLECGAFPWFKGMEPDRFITQNILVGIGKMQNEGMANEKEIDSIIKKGLDYLDKLVKKKHDILLKEKADFSQFQINTDDVQYLYMRSFFPKYYLSKNTIPAYNFIKKQAYLFRNNFDAYCQEMIALSFFRDGDSTTAENIFTYIEDSLIKTGTDIKSAISQSEKYKTSISETEKICMLIECYNEIIQDSEKVSQLKNSIFKHIKGNDWITTKATIAACQALLSEGGTINEKIPIVSVYLNKNTISISKTDDEPENYAFVKINSALDSIKQNTNSLHFKYDNINSVPIYAQFNLQYFAPINENDTMSKLPLSIKKYVYLAQSNGKGGYGLHSLSQHRNLKVGDKAVIKLEINVDRDYDYVHIKDMLAACFEPKNVLKGYRSINGAGYFEVVDDAGVNFYINHLKKGKYEFEYMVNTKFAGEFFSGTVSVQNVYSPEIIKYGQETKIKVVNTDN